METGCVAISLIANYIVLGNCTKIATSGMLVAPIKLFAFDLPHHVFINTLRFTGFDKKMDAVIEIAALKVGVSGV